MSDALRTSEKHSSRASPSHGVSLGEAFHVWLRIAALSGRGVFLAPGFVIAEDLEAGRLVPILPEYRPIEFAIHAIYPHRHHLSAKVRGFIDLLAERIVEHRRWMDPDIPISAASAAQPD